MNRGAMATKLRQRIREETGGLMRGLCQCHECVAGRAAAKERQQARGGPRKMTPEEFQKRMDQIRAGRRKGNGDLWE